MPETVAAETSPETTGGALPPTGAQAPGSAPQVFIGEKGELLDGWKDAFVPEDIRADKVLDTVRDVAGMAKSLSYYHRRMRDAGKVEPDETAPESEKSTYRKLRGVPDNPRDYKLAKPKDFPAEAWNDELARKFEDFAFAQGFSFKEVKAINDWNSAEVMAVLKTNAEKEALLAVGAEENCERILREKAGVNYEARLHLANKFIEENSTGYTEEEKKAFLAAVNDPRLKPYLFDVFATAQQKHFSEDTGEGEFEQPEGALSPAQAESKAKQMQANKEYLDGTMKQNNPEGYKEYQKEIDRLFAMAG